ncbi:hypothetical protein PBF_22167 [Cytobacillus firmus DS1]|uniref:Uncharacterized protein n=1 Tax=Cytobacillus firmus DS1 TaxID=1307436 RepID=W7KZV3_CYTFI|nr:hypothetical protein PBF_22167 [Cytobacillus firmus DS1]
MYPLKEIVTRKFTQIWSLQNVNVSIFGYSVNQLHSSPIHEEFLEGISRKFMLPGILKGTWRNGLGSDYAAWSIFNLRISGRANMKEKQSNIC